MSNEVKNHFTKTVLDYDTVVDSVVFENEELHRQIIRCLELPADHELKILDLGVGTGHGAGLALAKYPSAQLVGVDFSDVMLAKATINLREYTDRLELINSDINRYDPGIMFDAVISAVTIHNLTYDEKRVLFERIAKWLNPRGLFINGDFFQGETEELDFEAKRRYLDYVRYNLSGEELEAWLHHIQNDDKPEKLSVQSQLLEENGFDGFSVEWKFENEAVYWAQLRV